MMVMTWAQGAKGGGTFVKTRFCGVCDLELEAAACVCEGEGCWLCSLVGCVELGVDSIAWSVRVFVGDEGIDHGWTFAYGEGL